MQANELFDRPNTILLDGGMGTMLQAAGLKLGARPEELNITDPALIESIHARYAAAGSRIINANTFGASAHKLAGSEYTLEEIIAAGIANCKRACAPYGALAALDVGPLGELLEPNGTLAFEDAVAEYGRIVRAGVAAGADLVFLETFTDLYELKAALLAVKENSSLPVLASMSFEAGGRKQQGAAAKPRRQQKPAVGRGFGPAIGCAVPAVEGIKGADGGQQHQHRQPAAPGQKGISPHAGACALGHERRAPDKGAEHQHERVFCLCVHLSRCPPLSSDRRGSNGWNRRKW